MRRSTGYTSARRWMAVMALLTTFVVPMISAEDHPSSDNVLVMLVGDSTVTDSAGWGKAFGALVKPPAECVNLARSGASSKSYYDGKFWKQALEKKPDYVLIQFGHNDQPGKGPDRETDPQTTYREHLGKYIDEARQAGAKPVLVTSLTRRTFGKDGKIHSTLTPYVDAMKAVAKDKQVPLVDLHTSSIALCEKLGPQESLKLGPPHPQDPAKVDGTHLSEHGAKVIAPLVAEELMKAVPEFQKWLKATSDKTQSP